jgi:3'-phosphoadenosine 5'-phosphosulfate sulfotransferase (PAPS reductase)/FAD synthetase
MNGDLHMSEKPTRHLLGLSGGKDSAALAIYMRDRVPDMEYFFADTGAELPETLEFIEKMEDYLGKSVVRINSGRDFDYYLKLHDNFLPSINQRWCTINLKIKPFERFVGEDKVISYVGIRADEPERKGYVSRKPNITARFPFREDGLEKRDVLKILQDAGIGLPDYYRWRSRSGCYFCFFQQKHEWLGLYREHPDLFELAKNFEKYDNETGERYTWSQRESLDELIGRASQISDRSEKHHKKTWTDLIAEEEGDGCPFCFK